jgi:hypothetical protein
VALHSSERLLVEELLAQILGAGVPSIDDVLQGGVDRGSLVLDTAKKIRLDELPVLRTANDENELAHEKNKEDAAAVAAASQSS